MSESRDARGLDDAHSRDSREPGGEGPLGRRIGFAVAWGSLNAVLTRLGSFVAGIVAARILAPRDFGVFAIALTVNVIVTNFAALGVTACIVREPGDPGPLAPTVATISLASSATLTAIIFVIAPWLASELGAPQAAGPVRVMSLNLLLIGIYAVPSALLVRDFRQGKLVVGELLNFAVSLVLLIVLGLAGLGAFALAWSYVAGMAAMTIALIILCPARYWPGFSRRVAGTLLRFGLPLAGANLIGLSLYNIDYIVVGHRLGAVPLGLYLLAFTISSWPSSLFNGMVTSVALPAFSRVRDDAEKLPEYLTNVVSALEGIALPVSVLTLVVARSAIITVYGSRWSAASVALVTLALFGIVRVPVELFSNIIVALGRPRALFLTQALWIVVLLPAMVIGVDTWGIKGAGIAHFVVAGLVVLPVYLFVVRSVAGLSLRKLLVAIGPPVAGSIGAGLSAALAMRATNGALQSLVVGLGAGLVVYLIIVGPWLWRVLQRAHTLWSAVGTGPSPLAGAAAAS